MTWNCKLCGNRGNGADECDNCGKPMGATGRKVATTRQVDPLYGCCEYVSGGDRCHYPGVFKSDVLGGGRWLCTAHDGSPSQPLGAEVVRRSHQGIPYPDYSLDARKAALEIEETNIKARAWLAKRGIVQTPGMTNHEFAMLCRDYCLKNFTAKAIGAKKPDKSWAHKLKARHVGGEALSPVQVSAYREVLGHEAMREPGEEG